MKWQVIDGDIDYKTSQRRPLIINRSMSRKRWQRLYKAIRKLTKYHHMGNCGHEWDCCGCLSSIYGDWKVNGNEITISVTHSYNY